MAPTGTGTLTGTLTETVIDVADQHTVLNHIGVPGPTPPAAPLPPPLPFASAAAYSAMHTTIAKPGSRYTDVFGAAGAALDRLSPQYEDDKFWIATCPESASATISTTRGKDCYRSRRRWRSGSIFCLARSGLSRSVQSPMPSYSHSAGQRGSAFAWWAHTALPSWQMSCSRSSKDAASNWAALLQLFISTST